MGIHDTRANKCVTRVNMGIATRVNMGICGYMWILLCGYVWVYMGIHKYDVGVQG